MYQKKIWGQAVTRLNRNHDYTINYSCSLLGRSKQAYYKRKNDDEELFRRMMRIEDSVLEIRKLDPGIGYYKLWLMLKRMYASDWMPGRDSFLRMLRSLGLMQTKPRPRCTTNSNHRYHKYKNLIKGYIPTEANKLWVSDITYIDLVDGRCYLHLVTDAYSHKIMGWSLSESLEAEYTVRALQMAIDQTTADTLAGLTHHSDRGVQYCCNAYVDLLKKYDIRISMTEDYKPTDNAVAERVNGILKTEVIYRERRYKCFEDAKERIRSFIEFYNEQRPHYSIGMKVPSQVHQETGPQLQKWKSSDYSRGLSVPSR